MKKIVNKFDKKAIAELPKVSFGGRIIVIQSEGEAERAVDYLMSEPILGIDSETRPSFQKGCSNKVALLQVSTHTTCFLFRLNFIGIVPCLIRLLEDKSVLKVGLSLKDDICVMHRRTAFEPGNFVDLQDFVRPFGIEDMSLQKLYANIFNQKISKTQRLSNWEADVLTEAQKVYAATDAWACIMLYDELCRMRSTHDYTLVRIVPPEPVPASTDECLPEASENVACPINPAH
jgi:ribonuclease D